MSFEILAAILAVGVCAYAYFSKDARIAAVAIIGLAIAIFRPKKHEKPKTSAPIISAPDTGTTDGKIQDAAAVLDSVDDDRPGGSVGEALDLLDDADRKRRDANR